MKEKESMTRTGKKIVCICMILSLILTCILCVTPVTAKAAEEETPERVVRVGSFEDTFNYVNEKGARKGYGYELLETLSGYTGWKFEYVTCDWSNCFEKLINGEFDIMGDISYTEERAKQMLFSDEPMGEEKYYLYADLSDTDISVYNFQTLNGKRIGVLRGTQPEVMLTEWEQKYGLKTTHVNIANNDDVKRKLADHEIDAFVSLEESSWTEQGISTVVNVGKSGIYYAINKDHPEIKEELDNAMRRLEDDNPFYLADLYKQYFSLDYTPILSGEEKKWLKEHGAIRIGFLKDDAGISTIEMPEGRFSGAMTDYIQYATGCLGNQKLDFELTEYNSYEEETKALQSDEIDMIFHFSQNLDTAEEYHFAFTNTAWTYNLMAVTNKTSFNENESNRIAVPKDDLPLEKHIEYYYPQWEIVECDSVDDAANLVIKKHADGFVTGVASASDYSEKYNLYSLPLSNPEKSAFAVKSGNHYLLSILNKTIKAMPSNMLTSAIAMYESTPGKVTLAKFVKDNLAVVLLCSAVVIMLILISILGLLQKARQAETVAKQAADETQQLNKKLQIAVEKAESANLAKTNFLNNMSHDIRTPMNVILGYNQMLGKRLTDPKLLDYQEKIEQSGNLLLSIINNVLDMARIESGKVELSEDYVKISSMLREFYDVFGEEAQQKGITFLHEDNVVHQYIICDGTKIREIMINLVSNAIKYTPDGGTVSLTTTELPCSEEGYVRIKTEVTDTGIGMSKEYLPIIFESFSRERNTTAGKIGGTGLGMSIVKNLVDMMGGTIEVESESGKGSRFTVILQHRIADAGCYEKKSEKTTDASREILKGKHVLLAEDNDLNAEIAMEILMIEGLVIDRVEDGIQCVHRIEQSPAGTYDLILMDIQMPNMDGYRATEMIRGLSDKNKANIPIIAMTANAFEEDRKKALAKGMNGHIAKPVDAEKVEKTICGVLDRRSEQ